MARTARARKQAVKRNEIIDVARRLVYTKGYEQMTIQDILDELQISKGAFYHYFDSKQALLEALIERMRDEALEVVMPVVQDPHLQTIERFQRFFTLAARWKSARKSFILELMRVWYTDENALVRQKVYDTLLQWARPLLLGIIEQGVREGILTVTYPEETAEILLAIIQGLSDSFGRLLLSDEVKRDDALERAERLAAASSAAFERILGAPTGTLHFIDAETMKEWVIAARERM